MKLSIIAVLAGAIITIAVVAALLIYSKENNISEKQMAMQIQKYVHAYLEKPIASVISHARHGH